MSPRPVMECLQSNCQAQWSQNFDSHQPPLPTKHTNIQSYAIGIIGAFSRWPEVCWTTSPTSEFTRNALRETFSSESVPLALTTSNDTYSAAKSLSG